MQDINEITELSRELSHQRYMLNQEQVRSFFKDISVPDYIALLNISKIISKKDNGSDRAYLKNIAAESHLSVPQASKVIGNLRDKGFLTWTHDGDGSDGTYVTISEYGQQLIEQQEAQLKDYFIRVTKSFGKENMIALLQLMNQLEDVMDAELPAENPA